MLTQRSGRRVEPATLLMPMVEELLASTASGGATWSSSANTERLSSRSSKTASITKSASPPASRRWVVVRTRSSAAWASSCDSLPFSTRRARWPPFESLALRSCSSLLSWSQTSTPCSAACCAICAPMLPAPTTTSRVMRVPPHSWGRVGRGRALSLHREDPRHHVQGREVADQSLHPQPAGEHLRGHAAPHLVVVHGEVEEPDPQVAEAHHGVGVRADGQVAPGSQPVVDGERSALELERHALVDVGDPDTDAGAELVEVTPPLGLALDVGLDQAAQHRGEGARLLVRVVDQLGLPASAPYFSSGHSTGTRVVHSVISCEAFV